MRIIKSLKSIITVPVKGHDPLAEIVFPDNGSANDNMTARIIVRAGNGKPAMGLYVTRSDDGISLSPYPIEFEDGGEIDTLFVEFSEME